MVRGGVLWGMSHSPHPETHCQAPAWWQAYLPSWMPLGEEWKMSSFGSPEDALQPCCVLSDALPPTHSKHGLVSCFRVAAAALQCTGCHLALISARERSCVHQVQINVVKPTGEGNPISVSNAGAKVLHQS